MTAEELWQEYREQCCPPELGETSNEIAVQRQAFLCGIMAAIGNIIKRPECFDELRESIWKWMREEHAVRN